MNAAPRPATLKRLDATHGPLMPEGQKLLLAKSVDRMHALWAAPDRREQALVFQAEDDARLDEISPGFAVFVNSRRGAAAAPVVQPIQRKEAA